MTARKKTIEFLPQEEWEKGLLGKILKWIINVGRHVVIFTELIVILAFLSRFKFDRDLTDLGEKIKQQQAIINSWGSFEKEFRFLNARLEEGEKITKSQLQYPVLLEEFSNLVPREVIISSLEIHNGKEFDLSASSISERGVSLFIKNLKKSPKFENILLTGISLDQEKDLGIKFQIKGEIKVN